MSDDIDPEIAALLGDIDTYKPGSQATPPPQPPQDTSFDALFGDSDGEGSERTEAEMELANRTIEPVTKFEEDKPNVFFDDPQYYQKAIAGEGESSKRFHESLKKYLSASDPKDRGLYRQQVIVSYWNMVNDLVAKVAASSPIPQKQLLVRFGFALPTMLAPEQKQLFSRVIHARTTTAPVYYLDEWLRAIALGQATQSSTDEVKSTRSDAKNRFGGLLQKAVGKRDAAESTLRAKAEERRSLEGTLRDRVEQTSQHDAMPGYRNVPGPYTEGQKRSLNEVSEILKRLLSVDRELGSAMAAYDEATRDVQGIQQKMGPEEEEAPERKADLEALTQEFQTARQMLKMCVGRQGNHFPLVAKEYFHLNLREMGTRENVIDALAWIEGIDAQVFCRPHKGSLNRIEPYVLMLPCYGDQGICWEPFNRFSRHTSRARLAVPMYPKNLRVSVAYAVGDLRWQAAKEKASYYWMEEGLTGYYYQWFIKQKLKGDVKEFFILDYITWVTRESDGMQKLDKEVRGIFWRFMPFSQPIKDKLRDRSVVYQELYQRDVNKTLSDGY